MFGCAGFSLVRGLFSRCGKWVLLPSFGAQASHCLEHTLSGIMASVVVAPRL